MRAAGHGRIVFLSSVLGFIATRFRGAYVASKFAVEGYADTLRLELGGSGIEVVLIEPGPIASRFRETAVRHAEAGVDIAGSVHRAAYERDPRRGPVGAPRSVSGSAPMRCFASSSRPSSRAVRGPAIG